tara:strand:+ start:545 stop:754 length:210 start_codon:yes stop_codon:yes gene_type:complete
LNNRRPEDEDAGPIMIDTKAFVQRLKYSGERWIVLVDDGAMPIIGRGWTFAQALDYIIEEFLEEEDYEE